MPYAKRWFPNKKKRIDAKIGNTSVWAEVERAKIAGVPEVRGWRKDKALKSAADDLRCWPGVNSVTKALRNRIRKRRR
jgi:hypothetical protein